MSRQITQRELEALVGKIVTVQFDVTSQGRDGEDFQEIEGKFFALTNNGVVIKNRSTSRLIPYEDILDVEEIDKLTVRRLLYRWRREIRTSEVRQHLIDHHGMRFDIIDQLTPDEAEEMHDKIDHGPLGHGHGAKPAKRRRKGMNGTVVTDVGEEDEILPNTEPYDDDEDEDDEDFDEVLKSLNVVPIQKSAPTEEPASVSVSVSNSDDEIFGLDL